MTGLGGWPNPIPSVTGSPPRPCFNALSDFSTSRNTCEMSAPLADVPLSAPSCGLGANMPVTI